MTEEEARNVIIQDGPSGKLYMRCSLTGHNLVEETNPGLQGLELQPMCGAAKRLQTRATLEFLHHAPPADPDFRIGVFIPADGARGGVAKSFLEHTHPNTYSTTAALQQLLLLLTRPAAGSGAKQWLWCPDT